MKTWTIRGSGKQWEFISWPTAGIDDKTQIISVVEKSELEILLNQIKRAKEILNEITRIFPEVEYTEDRMEAIVLARKALKEFGE